jgi:hypothetical protein
LVRLADRGSSLPYEAAEIVFRDTRYHQKIKRWLEHRQEQFKNWDVRPDGTIGGIRIQFSRLEILPRKKPPTSVRLFPKKLPAKKLRIVFAA